MAKKKEKKSEELNAYILLDRSGSMSTRWDETLSSVNAYVEELKKQKVKGRITLATFDFNSALDFDVIRKDVDANGWKIVSADEAGPRGLTPLYDAVGRIVGLAKDAAKDKTVIVVVTDGAENASKELTRAGAERVLQSCRDKGWQVVFLGADFNAFDQAASVGVNVSQTLNMTAGNYGATMRSVAEHSALYACSNTAMAFSAEDRAVAMGKTKIKG